MADLSTLYNNRQKLYELSSNVHRLINQIGKCVDSLDAASSLVGDYYSIDGSRADDKDIYNNRLSLINDNNKLTGKVIPSINSKIASISEEIERLEREEREAREREEREAREAASKSSRVSSSSNIRNVSRGN